MPLCTFLTNLRIATIPRTFHVELAHLVAKVLNKPIERVTVTILSDNLMYRNGSDEPGAVFTIKSINVFSKENNPDYAKPLAQFIEEKLNLKGDRLCIVFHDLKPVDLAWPLR